MQKVADRVCLGQAYLLSPQQASDCSISPGTPVILCQIEMIDFWLPKHVTREELRYLPDELKPRARIDGKYLYFGQGSTLSPRVILEQSRKLARMLIPIVVVAGWRHPDFVLARAPRSSHRLRRSHLQHVQAVVRCAETLANCRILIG